MQFRHPLYGFFLAFGSCTLCYGATIAVDADGGGDYTTIQDAVDAAASGDLIEIESGTYVDDDGDGVIVAISSKDLTITAPDGGVILDGDGTAQGFAVTHATTYLYGLDLLDCTALDGEGGGGLLFDDWGGSGENLWIISCTFTSCSSPIEFDQGGAIRIQGRTSASPVNYEINDCIFTSCTSATYAGALHTQNASGLIIDTSFIECSADTGGACEFREGSCDIYQCVFQGNSTTNDGGAIRVYSDDADITIGDSSFTGNQADTGSAIYQSSGDVTLINCELIDNVSVLHGCLHLRDNDPAAIIEVVGCLFSGNETDTWLGDAGISGNTVVNLTVSDSILCDHPSGGDIAIAYTDGGGNDLGNWCCPGDIDGDGDVDAVDLEALLAGYGDGALDADDREDCSRDGTVDVEDLIGMLSQWGTCG